MKKLVIGILAHVDSGKTTLSEGMLYHSGQIRKLGRVDHGDAFLDTNEIEREKGITIFSKQAVLRFNNSEFTLLDTPGHIDFSAEMERTLQVLDYAILVISGSEGVQNHTETLWKLLIRYNVPVFLFINKMDISYHEKDELLSELHKKLSDGCVDFTDRGSSDFAEACGTCSEQLMEEFLETENISDNSIRKAIKNREIFPCFFGSALKVNGVSEFMDSLDYYTVMPKYKSEFGAKVFKIAEDDSGARLSYIKITGGTLKAKDVIYGKDTQGNEWNEKVDRVRIYNGEKFTTIDEALPGTVCAVTGLSRTYAGEGLGIESNSENPYLEPVLTYKVDTLDGTDVQTALSRLRILESEDPQLHVIWNEQLSEIHIQLMGEVQLEVLRRIIGERFNMTVDFGQGSIAYRETIASTVEGVGHFEPLRHYSEVHLILEPLPRGSGLKFETKCSEDALDKNWQRLILTHLREKTHIGVLTGSPIADIKITLAAGRAHKKHTEGGDFRQATYRAVRHGLMHAENILLEPFYSFRLEIPTENIGRAMTDLQQMGAEFSQPELDGDFSVITGSAPVSQMRSYHADITAYTAGRGKLTCILKGYEECRNPDEVIAERGYDPEADIANSPDSVFCAHGAGFLVKWDEVTRYMHLESVLSPEIKAENASIRASNFINAVVDDDELLRIFERTYGPVKHDRYNAVQKRTKKSSPMPKSRKTTPLPGGPLYILVDGYNIIFAWDGLKKAAEESLDLARELLIDRMCNYCGYMNCELILVFDAYKVKGNPGSVEKVHNINVVYTKEAETADAYIEKVTHELAKKHRVRVATSDNLEQIIILGSGAIRVSAAEFEKEVLDAETQIRKFIEQTF
ncbi:MAG: TetM/TetW/TetO/TetS family tetracycline resistance ribosomal protection protein [Oscillospiraceae bacterium]|nr:TetM/TetW/TetO/TetS family tetracycline resistance ribosomal protection protein [Oscillospiraceae bacterium]